MKLSDRKTFHEVVPYSSHVSESIVKTINNELVASWQLFGVSCECENDLDLDIINKQIHNFLKSFAQENFTFYVHNIRESFYDQFTSNSTNFFADKISELYYQNVSTKAFRANKIYFSLLFCPYSPAKTKGTHSSTLAEQNSWLEDNIKIMQEYCANVSTFLERFNGQVLGCFKDKGLVFSRALSS